MFLDVYTHVTNLMLVYRDNIEFSMVNKMDHAPCSTT